jgi:glycerophosphoryl diester phosphodiesterase
VSTSANTSTSEWRQPHPVWVVGHRGAPRRARENTLDSFDFAENLGADAVEFDVRQTRDGETIVFHDEQIQLGNQHLPVKSFTAREVEKLWLPSEFGEYRVPKLEEVFHRYGRALRYIIEVKSSPSTQRLVMARRVVHLAAVFGVTSRCVVASFDAEILKLVREADPAMATSFLFDRPVALPEAGRPTPLFPPVDAIGPTRELVTPALMEQATRAGLSVHPWTADEEPEIRRLLGLGVASVTTNAPEVALRIRDGAPSDERGVAVSRPA